MNSRARGIGFYVILLFIVLGVLAVLTDTPAQVEYQWSDIVGMFERKEVRALAVAGDDMQLELRDGTKIAHKIPSYDIYLYDLGGLIQEQRSDGTLEEQEYIVETIPWWYSFIPYLVIIVLFAAFWFYMMKKQDGGNAMNFGKSKARLVTDDQKKVTFQDVAGAEEEKNDLQEIVEFLKAPKKFIDIGARIPKGVLLVGPPGTGKTLIAKAVAGEAGVPFFSISGSDFVELYVGVGASRVRALFEDAKKHAPSIVFIDEIDAVGRQRGAGLGGGHDEREQTLNQLLVEMDGFGGNTGVIVIAATNRADILDPALLRPGRFDRQVYIGVPNIKDRLAILHVHARKKPLGPSVSLEEIARMTTGFTGAALENLLNEAALLSARHGKEKIEKGEVDEAFLKVVMGNEKKSRVMAEYERKLTAYHEAGHALASRMLPTQDPVQMISIIPRGNAGGFTMVPPVADETYESKAKLLDEIVMALGGRVAEELVFGDITSGATSDIRTVTAIARTMVTEYGMSDALGPISYASHNEVFLGRDFATSKTVSDDTVAMIDTEIKNIVDTAHKRCRDILSSNMDKLKNIADFLLEHETMDKDQFERVFTGGSEAAAEA